MNEVKPYRIIKVPFPLTPLSAFGYFLYKLAGMINNQADIAFHWTYQSDKDFHKPLSDLILFLFGPELPSKLFHLIESIDDERVTMTARASLKSMLELLLKLDVEPELRHRKGIRRLYEHLRVKDYNPKTALDSLSAAFEWNCLTSCINPFEEEIMVPDHIVSPEYSPRVCEVPRQLTDKRLVSRPKFDEAGQIIDWETGEFFESLAWLLTGDHIVIHIGGPADSGKSTLAASLFYELTNLVKELASRDHWQAFSLSVKLLDLDVSTRRLTVILSHHGQVERGESQPRQWTEELAVECSGQLSSAKPMYNIVIADLPGGPVDTITEIVSALGDVGIIVTRDVTRSTEWKELYMRMGIRLVAFAETRSNNNNADQHNGSWIESAVTAYKPHHFLSGRMKGVDRIARPWDPFISNLAAVLLFDLLPSFVEWKQEQIEECEKYTGNAQET